MSHLEPDAILTLRKVTWEPQPASRSQQSREIGGAGPSARRVVRVIAI